MNNGNRVRITRQYTVNLPPEQEGMIIPVQEFTFLRNKIERIEYSFSIYQTLLGLLIGIATSSVFTALTATSKIIQGACWTAFVASMLFSLIVYQFIRGERSSANQSKTDLLEEMERLESIYRHPTHTADESDARSESNR
jgi:hypothetical protein